MTRLLRIPLLCAWGLCLAAAGVWGADVAPARRVVSMGPAITDQICLLDGAATLVGVTTYCRLPPAHTNALRIGTVTGMNVEQMLALRPDLVLATGMTHPRDIDRLEGLGLRVVRFHYAADFPAICEQFLELGQLLGVEARAAAVVAEARTRLAAVEARVAERTRPTVFIEIGAKPLFTASTGTFIHDMLVRAGAENIGAAADGGLISREQVVARDPAYILIVTMETAAEQEQALWSRNRALQAARENRVLVLDAYDVCSPTPPGFVKAVEHMSALFHPPEAGP